MDDAHTAEDLGALQDAVRTDASKAQATFGSSSELTSGLRSKITIRDQFTIHVDEPEGSGGRTRRQTP